MNSDKSCLNSDTNINNDDHNNDNSNNRSSHPEVFLEKGVLKICSKFTGEHPCRSEISNGVLL